jgi:carboxyl-terminal processing protease
MSKPKASRAFLPFLLLVLACGFAGAVYAQHATGTSANDADVRDNLKKFTQIYSIVEENYADPVSADKAIYNGAIPGMLHVLDPHSNFFDPKQFASLREEQRGKYFGIGMQIGRRNNRNFVAFVFSGSPAFRAGLRAGDIVYAVDGKPTDDLGTSDVVDLVKGPRNTIVNVSVLRGEASKPIVFNILRDEIPLHSVDVHFEIRPGIGYMHLTGFGETTDAEVGQALDEFGDLKGLILDLRQNPGGLIDAGVGVADKFLKKGSVIVSHHGRSSAERAFRAVKGNGGKDYPLVVLVNRGTASAAEIVAGAIQDHDRGLIAGEVTFGKGLVQSVWTLSQETGLALTTAKYYTPSGRLIQREYEGVSLYDYYTDRKTDNTNKELKVTDSGRTVFGGGGITPDEKIETPKLNPFQIQLFQKYAFFNFGNQYANKNHVERNFQVTDDVVQEFRRFLDAQKVEYNQSELVAVNDWLRANIKSAVLNSEYGQEASQRPLTESDPEVIRALDLLPKAKLLAEGARKTIAQRSAVKTLTP